MYCKVTEQIFDIFRLFEEEKKKPRDYGNGIMLYHGEMQFLEMIAKFPDDNVSKLSKRLGITKGAITQMVEKLKQKKLIQIVSRMDNRKEKYFALTDKGQSVIDQHRQLHKQSNESICRFVSTLKPEEADAVFRFLEHVKQSAPFCEFRCSCYDDHESIKEENYDTNTAKCTRPACHS